LLDSYRNMKNHWRWSITREPELSKVQAQVIASESSTTVINVLWHKTSQWELLENMTNRTGTESLPVSMKEKPKKGRKWKRVEMKEKQDEMKTDEKKMTNIGRYELTWINWRKYSWGISFRQVFESPELRVDLRTEFERGRSNINRPFSSASEVFRQKWMWQI
jgi:hypothetical protein